MTRSLLESAASHIKKSKEETKNENPDRRQVGDSRVTHAALPRTDGHSPEDFASFFTVDGVFCAIYGEYKGRQAIAGFIAEHIKKGAEDHARHLLTNLVVEELESSPLVRCYVTKIRLEPPPITIVAYAGLQARMVKENASWRIGRL